MGKIGDKIKMSYFTEGEKRWIKRHTEKTFKELNIKGVNMNIGTVKSPKWDKEMEKLKNPIISKLLKLKYRINDTAKEEGGWSDDMSSDKRYVQSLLTDIRKHKFTKLAPEDGHCCNGLWRKYEG